MTVKLLYEHHLEMFSLKGGCTGSNESTLVKMTNCWKSHYGSIGLRCYTVKTLISHVLLFVFMATKNLCLPLSYEPHHETTIVF